MCSDAKEMDCRDIIRMAGKMHAAVEKLRKMRRKCIKYYEVSLDISFCEKIAGIY
jgi:hypothetical protein